MRTREDSALRILVLAASIAFAWILAPFSGALLWAVVFAIVFDPLNRQLASRLPGRPALAAIVTELFIVVMLILPLMFVVSTVMGEVMGLYQALQSGALNPASYLLAMYNAAPEWVTVGLGHVGLSDPAELGARASGAVARLTQRVAPRVLNLGQSMLSFALSLFVMLYVLFFLLRDGARLTKDIVAAMPLGTERAQMLMDRFTSVIRATVKSNLLIAVLQGALGALIFALLGIRSPVLWGMLMAVLSLLPMVGAILVWLPAALYLLATGATWKGVVLIAYGVLVIGLVDNVVRPLVVGKDARMPDYVVLLSTLGGISLFGVNGFIIGPLIAATFITAWHAFEADGRRVPDATVGPMPDRHAPLRKPVASQEKPVTSREETERL